MWNCIVTCIVWKDIYIVVPVSSCLTIASRSWRIFHIWSFSFLLNGRFFCFAAAILRYTSNTYSTRIENHGKRWMSSIIRNNTWKWIPQRPLLSAFSVFPDASFLLDWGDRVVSIVSSCASIWLSILLGIDAIPLKFHHQPKTDG